MRADLRVEMVPVARLVPYAANSRTHSAAQVAQLAASIREFGFNVPVLVDDRGVLIAGHGRVMAAKQLGLAAVPSISLSHLTEAQARAYRIADNKLALNSGWDEDLLKAELAELQSSGFDINVIGFSPQEIGSIFAPSGAGATDPDDVPEPDPKPISRPGDVWILGRHRLACGDSEDALTVERVLAGRRPHLMITDPPYGVDYDPSWRVTAKRPDGRPLSRGKVSMGVVLNDDRADWRAAWGLFPGDVAYVWHGGLHAASVAESLEAAGFAMRSQIIWVKQQLVIGRGDYHWMHEPCWYAVRTGRVGHYCGDRKQRTIWEIANAAGKNPADDGKTEHGTQKPVECMRRPIENNSIVGDAVYEPFSGSGTTIIAAEMTGRECMAVELNPVYVDVAVRRWQSFTNRSATLDGDGRSFAEMEQLRGESGPA